MNVVAGGVGLDDDGAAVLCGERKASAVTVTSVSAKRVMTFPLISPPT